MSSTSSTFINNGEEGRKGEGWGMELEMMVGHGIGYRVGGDGVFCKLCFHFVK